MTTHRYVPAYDNTDRVFSCANNCGCWTSWDGDGGGPIDVDPFKVCPRASVGPVDPTGS